MLGLSASSISCGAPLEDVDDTPTAAIGESWNEGSTLVELVTVEGGVTTRSPVILTPRPDHVWSSAFRLVCRSNCEQALLAFGYRTKQFVREYPSVEALRHGERLDATIPIVDLALEDVAAEPPVLAAYRVVDASDAADPRYLVRLRAAPDTLYAPLCENFLRVAQGNLETVPMSKALLSYWGVTAGTTFPRIGCAALDGTPLSSPPAAPPFPASWEAPEIDSVWTVSTPDPRIRAATYAYLVTRDARGDTRGFAVDCGSDTFSALASLGVTPADVRTTPASESELAATHFGEQPVIRCAGASGVKIRAVRSSNDAARSVRFQFESERDLVEFTCIDTESYWSARATTTLDLPAQALPHLSDAAGGVGETRTFKIGCRGWQPTRPTVCGVLRRGQGLRVGESQPACNGRFALSLQTDGNLVLSRKGKTTWSTKTEGTPARALIMQPDGNLVLYDARKRALWSSRTFADGAFAHVQTDGNFVVYDASNKPLWSSNTWQPPIDVPTACGIARAGEGLLAGESVWSCDKRFQLVLQTDGNLVLYKGKTALWSTKTRGQAAAYVSMQNDGNLVVYEDARKALWSSATHNNAGAHLAVQNDGNMVVYKGTKALWSTGTAGQ